MRFHRLFSYTVFGLFLVFCPPLQSQQSILGVLANSPSTLADTVPSFEAMLESVGEGDGAASMDKMLENMRQGMIQSTDSENTVESVATAIMSTEESLVVQEVIPEANLEIVEMIDRTTRRYPPRLRIDFKIFPLRNSTSTLAHNTTHVPGTNKVVSLERDMTNRISKRLQIDDLEIRFNGRIAEVSGSVRTERERSLVESMLRFEPGIDRVDNRLVVVQIDARIH